MPRHRSGPAAVFAALVLATAGCSAPPADTTASPTSGSPTSGSPTAGTTGGPTDTAAPSRPLVGQTFPTGLFSFAAPRGWARTSTGSAVRLTSGSASVRIVQYPARTSPTEASFRGSELPALQVVIPGFRLEAVQTVAVPAGSAVLATFRVRTDPTPGATVEQDVWRYELWRAGQQVVVTLSGPPGSVDRRLPQQITESLRWRR